MEVNLLEKAEREGVNEEKEEERVTNQFRLD